MADKDWQTRIKTGRNEPCPCGSGKKYKKCHQREDEAAQSGALAKTNEEAAAKHKKESEEGGHDHHGHGPHDHHHHHGGGGHTPKPGSPVVKQVNAPRKVGSG